MFLLLVPALVAVIQRHWKYVQRCLNQLGLDTKHVTSAHPSGIFFLLSFLSTQRSKVCHASLTMSPYLQVSGAEQSKVYMLAGQALRGSHAPCTVYPGESLKTFISQQPCQTSQGISVFNCCAWCCRLLVWDACCRLTFLQEL